MNAATRLAFAAALTLVTVLAPTRSHADVQVNDSGVTLDLDCNKDPAIQINGSSTTITTIGPCTSIALNGAANTLTSESVVKLSVTGAKNAVVVGAVDRIDVSGSSNKINYKSSVNGKKTKVSKSGIKNSIKKSP